MSDGSSRRWLPLPSRATRMRSWSAASPWSRWRAPSARPCACAGIAIGVAGIVFAVTATSLANAADPPRWYWPVAETTAVRLLADPGATRYLVEHDFPFDEQMRTLPEQYIYLYDPVHTGAEFAAFRHWVRSTGGASISTTS